MSEPKRMGDVVFDTLASMSLTIAGGPKLSRAIAQDINASRHAIVAEARRSRAREKRLEGRLREMVDALDHDTAIDPGSILHEAARAALSEET